jgi:hypothetical protein
MYKEKSVADVKNRIIYGTATTVIDNLKVILGNNSASASIMATLLAN